MLIREFIDCLDDGGSVFTDADLSQFQQLTGAELPVEYVNFLRECNGGYVLNDLSFEFTNGFGQIDRTALACVGGIRQDKDDVSLHDAWSCYQHDQKRIASELIWVMGTHTGDAVCLGVDPQVLGKVFFWDQAGVSAAPSPEGLPRGCGNVYLLANTFEEFIKLVKIDF